MKDPGMAKVWHELAADNRALLAGIRGGLGRRRYTAEELKMLEAEAGRYEQLAAEYEAEQAAAGRSQTADDTGARNHSVD